MRCGGCVSSCRSPDRHSGHSLHHAGIALRSSFPVRLPVRGPAALFRGLNSRAAASEGLKRVRRGLLRLTPGVLDAGLAATAAFASSLYAVREIDGPTLGAYSLFFAGFVVASTFPHLLLFFPAQVGVLARPPGERAAPMQDFVRSTAHLSRRSADAAASARSPGATAPPARAPRTGAGRREGQRRASDRCRSARRRARERRSPPPSRGRRIRPQPPRAAFESLSPDITRTRARRWPATHTPRGAIAALAARDCSDAGGGRVTPEREITNKMPRPAWRWG